MHNKDAVSDGSCKLFYFEYTGNEITNKMLFSMALLNNALYLQKKFFLCD